MASDLEFVEFVTDGLDVACGITFRKMFGEYALYSRGKVVALVCDNQLFVKPTDPGRAFVGDVVEGAPYPGAKPAFLVGDRLEDKAWLSRLLALTEAALPAPRPKKKKKKKKKSP